MSDYTPTTDEVRWAYGDARCTNRDDPAHAHGCPADAEFGRWLAAHDAKVHAEALRAAADAVHSEARWQAERVMRGAVMKSGAETAVERLSVVEELLRQQAACVEQEGREHEC